MVWSGGDVVWYGWDGGIVVVVVLLWLVLCGGGGLVSVVVWRWWRTVSRVCAEYRRRRSRLC